MLRKRKLLATVQRTLNERKLETGGSPYVLVTRFRSSDDVTLRSLWALRSGETVFGDLSEMFLAAVPEEAAICAEEISFLCERFWSSKFS